MVLLLLLPYRKEGFVLNTNKIYVVGIGSGDYENMTIKAVKTLEKCDTIIGYETYIKIIKPYFTDKHYLSTPMTKEIDRCKMCFDEALKGKNVAMICSGDAGVYGMAELMYRIGQDYPSILIEVISGVTAALSGAAILGAPLIQDFAVISLSDLLTSWEKIEKRLHSAASSDMVICLYNPSSHKRHDYLAKACDIILEYASPDTICGIVKNIGRDGETSSICTLKKLRDFDADMFTTVFIGNSQTENINGHMITARGYKYRKNF